LSILIFYAVNARLNENTIKVPDLAIKLIKQIIQKDNIKVPLHERDKAQSTPSTL